MHRPIFVYFWIWNYLLLKNAFFWTFLFHNNQSKCWSHAIYGQCSVINWQKIDKMFVFIAWIVHLKEHFLFVYFLLHATKKMLLLNFSVFCLFSAILINGLSILLLVLRDKHIMCVCEMECVYNTPTPHCLSLLYVLLSSLSFFVMGWKWNQQNITYCTSRIFHMKIKHLLQSIDWSRGKKNNTKHTVKFTVWTSRCSLNNRLFPAQTKELIARLALNLIAPFT